MGVFGSVANCSIYRWVIGKTVENLATGHTGLAGGEHSERPIP